MTIVVGVDGGGTKTDACVATSDGQILAFGTAGGGNWEMVGLDAMRDTVAAVIADALGRAGLRSSDVAAWACCLAGVDWPSDVDRVTGRLTTLGLRTAPFVTNDAFASLRAGAPAGVGLVSIAGTGGVTAGRDRKGQTARTMGLGIGDGAGAGGIARGALQAVARYHHGQVDNGERLASALCLDLGCVDLSELFEGVSRGRLRVGPEQARVVLDLADAGDPLAGEVTVDEARRHGADVAGIARRLGLDDEPVTVVAAGGVHTRCSRVFSPVFAETVAGDLPRASIRRLTAPPVAGAALLALDVLGPVSPDLTVRINEATAIARARAAGGSVPSAP